MEDKQYTTILGDTFDLIASKMYGDSKAIKKIIDANSQYSGTFIFSAGIVLNIPLNEEVSTSDNIAPWRR
ncbi:MAG: tail protein X [Bacilli bacterium]